MKCAVCKKKVEVGVLEKIKGTYLVKGRKKKPVCSKCQKKGHAFVKKKVRF